MAILILGIVIFLGVHTFSAFRGLRAWVIGLIGEKWYKIAYSIKAALGLVLIIWGFGHYRSEGLIPVWSPPPGMRHLTITLMWFAFVAFAAANPKPSKIHSWLRHPMLVGIMIWSLAHLLANGDLGGMILFGSFFVWAAFDRIAVTWRGDKGPAAPTQFTRSDVIALIAGTVIFVAMLFLHPILIGVPVLTG